LHLFGPNQKTWLDKLNTEHYNLNYALRWSGESDDRIESGLRLAGALARYWEVRNFLTEGRTQYEEFLARAGETVPPDVLAKAELGAGRLSWCQDRNSDALRHYGEALRLYQKLGQTAEVGFAHAWIGFTKRNEGNNKEALEHFAMARAIGEKEHSLRLVGTVLSGLGSLAADAGDLAAGRKLKEESLEKFRAFGDKWIIGIVSWSVGKVCVAQRDHPAARRLLNESLTISRELGNKWSVPYPLEAIGDLCAEEENGVKAVRLYGKAAALREALGLAFSSVEQAEYEAAMKRLHQLVPDPLFKAEWEAGKSLPLEAAIQLAME